MYPFELCRAILVGLRNQLRLDGELKPGEVGVQATFEEAETEGFYDMRSGEQLAEEELEGAAKVFNLD